MPYGFGNNMSISKLWQNYELYFFCMNYSFNPNVLTSDSESVLLKWFGCVRESSCGIVCTGRNLDEQLAELTRQVLRLPEVESVLQRAGLHPAAAKDPKPAMAVFIKVHALKPEALTYKPYCISNTEYVCLTRLWVDHTVSSSSSLTVLQRCPEHWSM